MKDFQDKVVIITGGGSGIGQATALGLAARGAQVVVGDLNEAYGREIADLAAAEGGNVQPVVCDMSSATSVKELIDQTISRFGRLDGAFNNAGVPPVGVPPTRSQCRPIPTHFAVNTRGGFRLWWQGGPRLNDRFSAARMTPRSERI